MGDYCSLAKGDIPLTARKEVRIYYFHKNQMVFIPKDFVLESYGRSVERHCIYYFPHEGVVKMVGKVQQNGVHGCYGSFRY